MNRDNNRGMRDWLIFIRTAESGSLAEVARQLGISTPAVSKAVTRVEQYLGVALFTRTIRECPWSHHEGSAWFDDLRLMESQVSRSLVCL